MRHSSTVKILNRKYFGPSGIVKRRFELISLEDFPITKEVVSQKSCSIVFLGRFYDPKDNDVLTSNELKAVRSWSLEHPNNLVVVSEQHSKYWGYEYVSDSTRLCYPTIFGEESQIFNGPFGHVPSFEQGGMSYGYLASGNGKSLATNAKKKVTISLDEATNDIILADIDLLTALGGVSKSKQNRNISDVLACNFWAYASQLSQNVIPIKSDTNFEPTFKSKENISILVNFEQSKSSLLSLAIKQLDSLSYLIGRQRVKVTLRGYSDVIGDSESNLTLSKYRVKAVRKHLTSNGIKRRYIKIQYFGSNNPIYRGKNDAQRGRNRRVEISVIFQ